MPYFDGERTPNRPDATRHAVGLRTDCAREQVARAAVEGVVCGLLDGLDALRAAGVPTPVDGATAGCCWSGAAPARRRTATVLADLAGMPGRGA